MTTETAIKVIDILANRVKDVEMMRDFYDSKNTEALAENEKLAKRIAELEARNAELEVRNAELESLFGQSEKTRHS